MIMFTVLREAEVTHKQDSISVFTGRETQEGLKWEEEPLCWPTFCRDPWGLKEMAGMQLCLPFEGEKPSTELSLLHLVLLNHHLQVKGNEDNISKRENGKGKKVQNDLKKYRKQKWLQISLISSHMFFTLQERLGNRIISAKKLYSNNINQNILLCLNYNEITAGQSQEENP